MKAQQYGFNDKLMIIKVTPVNYFLISAQQKLFPVIKNFNLIIFFFILGNNYKTCFLFKDIKYTGHVLKNPVYQLDKWKLNKKHR